MGNENCSYLRKPTLKSSLASGNRPLGIQKELLSFQTLFRSHRTKNVGCELCIPVQTLPEGEGLGLI